MKFTRINDFFKLFVVILAIVSLISVSLTSCGGGGGGGGGAASGPAEEAEGSGSSPAASTPAAQLSSNKEILSFSFKLADNPSVAAHFTTNLDGNAVSAEDAGTVTVSYPFNTLTAENLRSLKPTIEVSPGASILPASGEAQDFTSSVVYTVKAQDGTEKVWTVSVTQLAATERRITYDLDGGVMKVEAPNSFNVEEGADLPDGSDLVKDNYYFTGWFDPLTGADLTSWGPNAKTEDVTAKALWSPAPYIEGHRIYANGMNVTVKKNSANKTMVYFRGVNGNEIALSAINAAADYQDLTDYTLFAGGSGNINNTGIPATDCIITMEGGSLSNIYGYNGNGTNLIGNVTLQLNGGTVTTDVVGFNRSTSGQPANVAIKVSGNPTVGDKTDNGIWLNSFTSPVVNLTGSISSASAEAITLIAAGATQNGTHVAESVSGDYADAGKFKLLNSNRNSSLNVGKNGSYVVVIGSVSLPEVPIWGNGDAFTLGDGHVLEGGTYFSIFVDGGYFTVPSTTLTGANFDMAVPYAANGNIEFKDGEKGESLSTSEQYRYVQFKSASGNISSQNADAYLAGITFHGTNVKVSVNLQTVPFSEIQSNGVTYFNGSFYKIIDFPNKTSQGDKSWDTAYNAAKAESNKFNGLHGYLMTITSDVENKFIYDRVYKNKNVSSTDATGWLGATRGINQSGNYDAATWSFASSLAEGSGNSDSSSLRAAWYWACGPEAGQQFYNTRKASSTGRVSGMYSSWNNSYDIPANGITDVSAGSEPNNSNKEYCAQYVGTYIWNDLSHNKNAAAGQFVPGSYIIEYSVYKNAYNEERATNTALSDSKTYTRP